eukprot:scaffold16168_cov110-Isochrysis_galbana.AAC.9
MSEVGHSFWLLPSSGTAARNPSNPTCDTLPPATAQPHRSAAAGAWPIRSAYTTAAMKVSPAPVESTTAPETMAGACSACPEPSTAKAPREPHGTTHKPRGASEAARSARMKRMGRGGDPSSAAFTPAPADPAPAPAASAAPTFKPSISRPPLSRPSLFRPSIFRTSTACASTNSRESTHRSQSGSSGSRSVGCMEGFSTSTDRRPPPPPCVRTQSLAISSTDGISRHSR